MVCKYIYDILSDMKQRLNIHTKFNDMTEAGGRVDVAPDMILSEDRESEMTCLT